MRNYVALALGLVLAWPATTLAGFYDDIYRGLQYFVTPLGSPVSTLNDGTRVNGARNGRVRIAQNRGGDGFRLELDRTFGVDNRGRPEILDLGAVELALQGTTNATFGYTTRGFLIGNAQINANNLNYAAQIKTGAQDTLFTGQLNIQNSLEINQFGFYSATVNVSNANSRIEVDGVVVRDQQDTNFDIGPIVVEGNIFYDGLLSILSGAGVDTTALEAISPKSPIDTINDAITEQLQKFVLSAGLELEGGVAPEITLSADAAAEALPDASATAVAPESAAGDSTIPTPEPASLALLVLGGAVFARRR